MSEQAPAIAGIAALAVDCARPARRWPAGGPPARRPGRGRRRRRRHPARPRRPGHRLRSASRRPSRSRTGCTSTCAAPTWPRRPPQALGARRDPGRRRLRRRRAGRSCATPRATSSASCAPGPEASEASHAAHRSTASVCDRAPGQLAPRSTMPSRATPPVRPSSCCTATATRGSPGARSCPPSRRPITSSRLTSAATATPTSRRAAIPWTTSRPTCSPSWTPPAWPPVQPRRAFDGQHHRPAGGRVIPPGASAGWCSAAPQPGRCPPRSRRELQAAVRALADPVPAGLCPRVPGRRRPRPPARAVLGGAGGREPQAAGPRLAGCCRRPGWRSMTPRSWGGSRRRRCCVWGDRDGLLPRDRSSGAWRPRSLAPGHRCTPRPATAPIGSAPSGSPPTWMPSCEQADRTPWSAPRPRYAPGYSVAMAVSTSVLAARLAGQAAATTPTTANPARTPSS